MPPPIDALTQINLDDLVAAFGLQGQPRLARAVRWIFRGAARKFAGQMIDFDAAIGRCGLPEAARRTQRLFVREVRVFGADPSTGSPFVPRTPAARDLLSKSCETAGQRLLPSGPILALSNHPGMTDTLALFCALNRPDLKIIALNRPFLLSLPDLSRQLFYVTDDPSERVALVRRVSGHLRAGGAILTFPAGHTEPDPDVYDGAVESLQSWTDSVGVFIRLAPETAVLPMVVRSVVWASTAHHPILRLKRTRDERELLAVALQLLLQILLDMKPVTAKVQIGRPITAQALGSTNTTTIHQAVLAEMKRLLENPPEGEGISAL